MASPRFQGIPVPPNASPEIASLLAEIERWVTDRDREPRALPVYTVATVPPAEDWTGCAIGVSDETGGYTVAQSDGTDWRRVSDGAVIS